MAHHHPRRAGASFLLLACRLLCLLPVQTYRRDVRQISSDSKFCKIAAQKGPSLAGGMWPAFWLEYSAFCVKFQAPRPRPSRCFLFGGRPQVRAVSQGHRPMRNGCYVAANIRAEQLYSAGSLLTFCLGYLAASGQFYGAACIADNCLHDVEPNPGMGRRGNACGDICDGHISP